MPPSRLWLQWFERGAAPGLGRREQLCASLRQAMREGDLQLGERLPSSRMLAADLGLSRVTVEAAYGQLEAEGYLSRRIGQGSFVAFAQTPQPAPRPPAGARIAHLNMRPPPLSQRGQRIADGGACEDPRCPLPFAAGSPDLRAFPLPLWRQLIKRRLSDAGGRELLGYGEPQGLDCLREAIAGYLRQARGLRCSAEQVLVLTSSQQALQLLAGMLLDEGDRVWMEEPGYRGAATAFAAAGARLRPVPVDAQGLCPPERGSEPPPRLIYLTPSHQYPSGVALSLARRQALLELARREGCWLIEDDYDSEFHYEGRPMPALQGLQPEQEPGRVLYLGTFSKALFPSLRLAYLVLPPELVAPLCTARSIQDGHSALLPQAVTADFISQGHFAAHLRLMRQLYRQRREVLMNELQARVGDWLRPQPSPGGLQIAALLPPGEEARWSRRAAGAGLLTPSLSALYRGPARLDGWLLGFAALTPAEIVVAVQALTRLQR
ncbi:MocR-like pyridoxine biosynthesis transcription factor PdxR [Kinneretia aquatilis]|uniref:MocR-like pyridoxine biosynthesis transcription factor PdxR n=1 Tax=Kinneretia aquatilis TaxID=2070761 RepID=UPI001495182D|nr:PLP-dependent aminotransferase family protein [Paucibacter aquatile]WIV98740.1 PLP-dependent aminotransferase family protein [Paucibacter aquatile]